MASGKKRLSLELDAPLQQRLKAAAELKGVSMRQYCQKAIEKELDGDEPAQVPNKRPQFSRAERFAALQEKHFGDRVLPGNSVDLIREAREMRTAQLERAIRSGAHE